VARVVVDADDVAKPRGHRQRVALVARAPALVEGDDRRHGQEAVHDHRPVRIDVPERFELALHEGLAQPPGMLDAERVDRLVLELPRDDRASALVSGDNPRDESLRGRQELGMRLRRDQRAFSQRHLELVQRHVHLGVAEVLDGAHSEDHLLARSLGDRELPVELGRVESVLLRLDAVPVRRESDDLEPVGDKLLQRRDAVKAERVDLARAKADPQPAIAARLHWEAPPAFVDGLFRPCQPEIEDHSG